MTAFQNYSTYFPTNTRARTPGIRVGGRGTALGRRKKAKGKRKKGRPAGSGSFLFPFPFLHSTTEGIMRFQSGGLWLLVCCVQVGLLLSAQVRRRSGMRHLRYGGLRHLWHGGLCHLWPALSAVLLSTALPSLSGRPAVRLHQVCLSAASLQPLHHAALGLLPAVLAHVAVPTRLVALPVPDPRVTGRPAAAWPGDATRTRRGRSRYPAGRAASASSRASNGRSRRQKAEGRRQKAPGAITLSLLSAFCFLLSAFCLLPSALCPRLKGAAVYELGLRR